VSDISQIKIVSLGITLFNFELMIEAHKLRSIPGSSIFKPREIFEYTSLLSSFILVYFQSTATIKSSFELLIPLVDLFGYPNLV
jgi:hypothetical protein